MDQNDFKNNTPFTEDEIERTYERRRARRRRDRRLKRIFLFVLIAALLAAFALIYAYVLVPRDNDLPWPKFLGSRPGSAAGSMTIEKETEAPAPAAQSETAAAPADAAQTPDAAPGQDDAQPSDTAQTPDPAQAADTAQPADPAQTQPDAAATASADISAQAQLMAAGYDYDGAIAKLMEIPGYESDAAVTQMIADFTAQRDACVPVDPYTVPHIFYHSLVNAPTVAFNPEVMGQSAADGFNAWMVTTDEFDQVTQRLYDAGYVYVRLRDLVTQTTDADGTVHFAANTELKLPPGKKAIVLSVDDCSYYHSYAAASYPDKLVLDENGKVKCLYTDPAGNTSVGDYDVVPRLNTFLEQHPDGAYKGARGILAMTGYNGVFGYRTDIDYLVQENLMEDQRAWLDAHPEYNYDEDVAEATKIANALKEEGWEFASHTWGHLSVTDKTVDALRTDNEKWVSTVQPIVGPVDTIIFAHGNDIGTWEGYSSDNEKYNYFKSAGYNFYCNVDGSTPYWVQIADAYVRQGRVNVDGYRLWLVKNGEDTALGQIVDVSGIFNENRPTPVNASGQG